MEDIPSEKVFRHFPEQASKEGRLKDGREKDPLVGDDFVNQKEHAAGEEKWEQVSQGPLYRRPYGHRNPPLVTLEEDDKRAQNHAREEKESYQDNHG